MPNTIQSQTSKGVQGFSPPSASGSRALALRRWSVLGASRYYLTVKTLLNGLGRGNAGFLGLLPCKGCSPRPPSLLGTGGGGRWALLDLVYVTIFARSPGGG